MPIRCPAYAGLNASFFRQKGASTIPVTGVYSYSSDLYETRGEEGKKSEAEAFPSRNIQNIMPKGAPDLHQQDREKNALPCV